MRRAENWEQAFEAFAEENLRIANDDWPEFRKIGDVPEVCLNFAHNPPMYMVLEPGVYEHRCPGCGHRTVFTVPRVSY